MKAVVLHAAGPPEDLKTEELDDPTPCAGEVVVRVLAAGVCGHDLLARAGAIPRRFPVVLGHEVAGVVEAVGDGVAGLAAGDRVALTGRGSCGACAPCRSDHENWCREPRDYGDSVDGGYAERCRVAAEHLVAVPTEVSDEAAAVASCAIATSVHAVERVGVQPGERVLVTGAGGGVGVHALQVLRHRGAVAIAVTSSRSKVSALEPLTDVVVVAEGGDVRQALRRAGVRVDKALELTAGITLPGVLASLPAGGRVCVAGNLRGTPIPLESGRLIVRELEIVGSVGSRKRDLAASLALLAEGAVAPVIGATLPLRRAAEAHAAMEASAVTGRIVLKPW